VKRSDELFGRVATVSLTCDLVEHACDLAVTCAFIANGAESIENSTLNAKFESVSTQLK